MVVQDLVAFLGRHGYRVRLEVPNMGQSADIVAARGRWLTFIEAKVTDWRKALDQCRAHESVADYICVAVSTVATPRRLLGEAAGLGYGVIHRAPRSRRCRWELRPRMNTRVWGPQRQRLARVMRGISYAH